MKTTIVLIPKSQSEHEFKAPPGHRLVTAVRLDQCHVHVNAWRMFWEPTVQNIHVKAAGKEDA